MYTIAVLKQNSNIEIIYYVHSGNPISVFIERDSVSKVHLPNMYTDMVMDMDMHLFIERNSVSTVTCTHFTRVITNTKGERLPSSNTRGGQPKHSGPAQEPGCSPCR